MKAGEHEASGSAMKAEQTLASGSQMKAGANVASGVSMEFRKRSGERQVLEGRDVTGE
jgi:hypothetical protein